MNTFQKIVVGVGIALALVLAVFALNKAGSYVVQQVAPSFGATTDFQTTVNLNAGVIGTRAMIQSTTTIACALQNPMTNATSTYYGANLNITYATSTVTKLGFATTTNAIKNTTATTSLTVLAAKQFVSTGTGNLNYVPASEMGVVGPGEWLVWYYVAGNNPAKAQVANVQGGFCNALFVGEN